MTYGMKIYSGNGALQLDSNDASHVIYQKHTSGTSSAITDVGSTNGVVEYGSTAITVSGFTFGEDLIFIQPTGSAVVKLTYGPVVQDSQFSLMLTLVFVIMFIRRRLLYQLQLQTMG